MRSSVLFFRVCSSSSFARRNSEKFSFGSENRALISRRLKPSSFRAMMR